MSFTIGLGVVTLALFLSLLFIPSKKLEWPEVVRYAALALLTVWLFVQLFGASVR